MSNKEEGVAFTLEPVLDGIVNLMGMLSPEWFALAGVVYALYEIVMLASNSYKATKFTPLVGLLADGVTDKFCWLFWVILVSSTVLGFLLFAVLTAAGVISIALIVVGEGLIRGLSYLVVDQSAITFSVVAIIAALVAYFNYAPEGSACKVASKVADKVGQVKPAKKLCLGVGNLYSVYKDKFCPIVTKEDK